MKRPSGDGGMGMGWGGNQEKKKDKQTSSTLLDLCVSSLRRGHANLLCIVPILSDDLRGESRNSMKIADILALLAQKMPPRAHRGVHAFPVEAAIGQRGARQTEDPKVPGSIPGAPSAARPPSPAPRSRLLHECMKKT